MKQEGGGREHSVHTMHTCKHQVPCATTQCKLDCDPLLYTPLTLRALEMPKKNASALKTVQRERLTEAGRGECGTDKKVQSKREGEEKNEVINKRR